MLPKILDITPALAFFITYKITSDLITATAVIVGCCLIAFALQYVFWKKVSRMQVFVCAAVLLFGLPTVLLNDPQIIKWKVTVVNLIMATAILVCQHILKRNPFSYLFGQEIPLPENLWLKLGTWWMIFFVFAAMLNVIIAFFLPTLFGIDAITAESLWVDYKTFGNAILNFVFAVICILYLMKTNPEILAEVKDLKKDNKLTK
ncbi:inner membrane-spanning protein YciB [Succinatimonas hippei]|uniref:Inner membrane-spanning protein YciB n=1 Tax=Succinatimonas hippei (strain DSM 22608 / JCM 16073 / KCTC 15190 / YIT 12066) TaxID=762983 RepID=E8LMG7_SUCHY|nr:septation protein IspZ [Succinatimonas hippei]EFY06289.1 intracellular septation protein A [Succinatimonas hippei YIT 12066]MCL1603403.1 septation protein IspZ [Succinatimonas hippei]MDM8121088.1 septation protein IspZ [Succinatimonas hippei]